MRIATQLMYEPVRCLTKCPLMSPAGESEATALKGGFAVAETMSNALAASET